VMLDIKNLFLINLRYKTGVNSLQIYFFSFNSELNLKKSIS